MNAMNMNDLHDRLTITMSYEECEAILRALTLANYEFMPPAHREVVTQAISFCKAFLIS